MPGSGESPKEQENGDLLGQQLVFEKNEVKIFLFKMKKKCQNTVLRKSSYNLHVHMDQIDKSKPPRQYNCYFTIISGLIQILVDVYCKQAGGTIS